MADYREGHSTALWSWLFRDGRERSKNGFPGSRVDYCTSFAVAPSQQPEQCSVEYHDGGRSVVKSTHSVHRASKAVPETGTIVQGR